MKLRTVKALCFPFVAACHNIVGAMSGKCPAIMQRPYDIQIVFFDIAEQHTQIYAVRMQVVKVNQLNAVPAQRANQPCCSKPRSHTVTAEHSADDVVSLSLYPFTIKEMLAVSRIIRASGRLVQFCRRIGKYLMSAFFCLSSYLEHDGSRTAAGRHINHCNTDKTTPVLLGSTKNTGIISQKTIIFGEANNGLKMIKNKNETNVAKTALLCERVSQNASSW